ncbi:cellulose biosynthesis protein BcsD [Asaia astilbis]|uniref:cellulose biosynthesis protein BcsD n=1 Tax=Asaia astilbis TaxID=610244 RepID=UPI00047001BC|nr:cellulose biosynthesis protein BcsD [Asaia astilbis]
MTAPDYSLFLHALATELDLQAGPEERDALLFSVGHRLSTRLPLPSCETTEDFELECNALLTLVGWGRAQLRLSHETRSLYLDLTGTPHIGSLGTPSGQWFAAVYAGVFTGWFLQSGEPVKLQLDRDASTVDTLVFLVAPNEIG